MRLLDELSDLLLPTRCAICQQFPSPVCEGCFEKVDLQPRQVSRNGIQGITFADYRDEIATLLNAFKERGQRRIGQRLAAGLPTKIIKPDVDYLLPAPTKALSFANRGFNPAELIAAALARQWGIPLAGCRFVRQPLDQVGLGRSDRQANLFESMRVGAKLAGARVLLVDDIVTSGATITELARAARQAGALVSGFITIAESVAKPATLISKKV